MIKPPPPSGVYRKVGHTAYTMILILMTVVMTSRVMVLWPQSLISKILQRAAKKGSTTKPLLRNGSTALKKVVMSVIRI